MSNLVKYGTWNEEQANKESKELSSGSDFWKPAAGRNVIRFLPPKVDWPSPFVVQHQHFIELPGVQNKIIYTCPREHKVGECVTCNKADKLERSGNRRDVEAAKKLRPQRRVMANIIVEPDNEEAAPVIYAFGKTVHDALKNIRTDPENGGDFMHPEKGFCIVIGRTGTKKDDTKYTVSGSRQTNKLKNMAWIDLQPDLRRLLRFPSTDQQERLLAGEDPRDVWGDGPSEDRPRRRRDRDDIEDAELVDDKPNLGDDLDADGDDLDLDELDR